MVVRLQVVVWLPRRLENWFRYTEKTKSKHNEALYLRQCNKIIKDCSRWKLFSWLRGQLTRFVGREHLKIKFQIVRLWSRKLNKLLNFPSATKPGNGAGLWLLSQYFAHVSNLKEPWRHITSTRTQKQKRRQIGIHKECSSSIFSTHLLISSEYFLYFDVGEAKKTKQMCYARMRRELS